MYLGIPEKKTVEAGSFLQGVLADVSIYTGYLTIGLMLGGRFVFQYLGWKIAALATPAIMFITGSAFFGLSLAASMGATGVIFGGVNLATGGALAGAVTQVSPLVALLPPTDL